MPNLDQFNRAHLATDGRFGQWSEILRTPHSIQPGWWVEEGVVHIGQHQPGLSDLEHDLKKLLPWRKGPFCVAGIPIDSEWRGDLKWDRIQPHINLQGHRVLDVGGGNGYFGWRMLEAGADSVVGCDPTSLFVVQHHLMAQWAQETRYEVWACRLETLPHTLGDFNVVFSMGVLSHRRYEPAHHTAHLGLLYRRLKPGGHLVLETLVVPTSATHTERNGDRILKPHDRYARMKNVYALPDPETLSGWLDQVGFITIEVVDESVTTADEQRATAWMPFQSLVDGLDPENPNKTQEGYPAPRRVVVLARRPS